MEDIIMIGCGGHAKSVADTIARQGKYRIVGYTNELPTDSDWTYLGTDAVLPVLLEKGICNAVVGIGYLGKGDIRQRLYSRLKDWGFNLPVICDPSAIVSDSAKIGEGTFIGKYAVVNAEAQLGSMVIINTKALVEHECTVSDFSHVAVSAVLCGQVTLGKGTFIGANATVIQNCQLGSHCLVAAGAVVARNVEDNCIVKRNL